VEAFDLHDLFSEDVNVCKPGLTMGSGGYLCVLAAAVLKRPAAAGTVVLQAARSLKRGGLLLLSEPGAHAAALEAARNYAEESGLFVAGASGEYSAPQKAKGRTLDKARWFAYKRTSAAAVDCEPLFKGLTREVCGHNTATGASCKKPCDFWLYDIGTEEGHRPGSTTSVGAVQRISTHINYNKEKTKGGGSQALWKSAISKRRVKVWLSKSPDVLPGIFAPLL